ncbi:hypothetical protein [Aminipila sp.]|uniref:hypothetical protein n=1 Tax=Aminipila sp. TaxID=2060095 RepID=UPI0028A1D964|nr:hypothetical protein [Aminipila sp.]
MIYKDTIELLKECNAGIKMGVGSIDEVLDKVQDSKLKQLLSTCKTEHQQLESESHILLTQYGDTDKEPSPVAKGMSWVKTNVKLSIDESDKAIADLMTDGCNMGVKSLNKYLNEYNAAQENAKNLVRRLIYLEEKLAMDIRSFL